MYQTSQSRRPKSLRLQRSLGQETLLKAPKISKDKSNLTRLGSQSQARQTQSIIIPRAIVVDLFSLAPICTQERREYSSTIVEILQATIFSRAFPIVLRRVIGLYAFTTQYDSFYSFLKTIVLEYLKASRQQESQRQAIKILARIGLSVALHSLRNLFRILLGPRALLGRAFFRTKLTSLGVTSQGIRISLGYQQLGRSSRLASIGDRKKQQARVATFPSIVSQGQLLQS